MTAGVVAGAFAGDGAPREARAENCPDTSNGVVAHNGYWAHRWTSCTGLQTYDFIVDQNGNRIPTDVPTPAYDIEFHDVVAYDGTVLHGVRLVYRAVYRGDPTRIHYCATADGRETHLGCDGNDPGALQPACPGHTACGWIRTWLRSRAGTVQGNAPPGPLVNQPGAVQYQPDANNRVVLGEDGLYYREWRVNGRWLRSNPYGTDPESLLRAQWNAFNGARNQRIWSIFLMAPTAPPPGASPDPPGQGGPPPGDDPPLSCEEQFADQPPRLRDLICSGI